MNGTQLKKQPIAHLLKFTLAAYIICISLSTKLVSEWIQHTPSFKTQKV